MQCSLARRIKAFSSFCDALKWTKGKPTGRKEDNNDLLFCIFIQKTLEKLEVGDFVVPEVSNNVIKMSGKGQVIKVQSQRNCPLHSKQPLNLY